MSDVFETRQLIGETSFKRPYHEFLRVSSMSAGMYALPVGANDRQSSHAQDEIYFVVKGAGKLRLGDNERPIATGDVVFVEANLEHRFFEIQQELVLLVIFAPAES